MADVETGIGPFTSTYLSVAHHWDSAQIGLVIGSQNIAGVLAQVPAGWLIDRVCRRKWLIGGAASFISIGALLIVAVSSVGLQIVNQVAIGIAAAFVSPTIAAVSLGLVGRQGLARRVGRNSAFSHAGNVTTALFAGYLAYAAGQQWIFYASASLGTAVLGTLFFIRDKDIDNNAARELASTGEAPGTASSLIEVFRRTRIGLFAMMILVFHLANAAMLPLAGQELAKVKPGESSIYMSACIVTAQLVMVAVAYLAGRVANRIGRKPIFLAAFAVLALRGVLFALGRHPLYIVGVEALDGVGTASASVAAVLVVSDLAKGTGRFNFMQGVMQAAVGIGAFLSNSLAGVIARHAGFPVAFSVLAGTAIFGFGLYWLRMPESLEGAAAAPGRKGSE